MVSKRCLRPNLNLLNPQEQIDRILIRLCGFMMSQKRAVFTEEAPRPADGLYNQAIVARGVIHCSCALPIDPKTGNLVHGDVSTRTVCQDHYYVAIRYSR